MSARVDRSGMEIRLRWWALVLPAAAFGALLLLLVAGPQADAAEQPMPVTQLIDHVQAWLP
ncbi:MULTISPECIES: hypothetical protein [unclassified Streptomyces]|uniref:Uncharacterized protein n=1 Tax=Streptomyces millisiae TaxID=3075542 RepID=A0ABU2LVB5_9ACTN|nr:hypothetical protein [Streptomyces sp. DSM 44918]MDT0321535.1 hypothetical protein [Streptomyces sp. DSM 44918]